MVRAQPRVATRQGRPAGETLQRAGVWGNGANTRPESHNPKWSRGPLPGRPEATPEAAMLRNPSGELQTRGNARPGGASGWSQGPEVRRRAGVPAKPARRRAEVGSPGGSRGCWATGAGAAGEFCASPSESSVAPTSCPGNFPSRPPPLFPSLLASRNPCPWHHVNLSGSHDALAPTCFEAKLHQKRSGSTPDVAFRLTDCASSTMGTYTYTSRPRALPCQRRRYRDGLMQP